MTSISRNDLSRRLGCAEYTVIAFVCLIVLIPISNFFSYKYQDHLTREMVSRFDQFQFQEGQIQVNDFLNDDVLFKDYSITNQTSIEKYTYCEWDSGMIYAFLIGDPIEHLVVFFRFGAILVDNQVGHNGLAFEHKKLINLKKELREDLVHAVRENKDKLGMEYDFSQLIERGGYVVSGDDEEM